MTPDETIEQQARREAHAAWIALPDVPKYTEPLAWIKGYAAALISERSKPQPSVDKVMAIVGPLCLGEATERHITDRLTNLFAEKTDTLGE